MRLIAYQWKCETCGTEMEVLRTMDDNGVPPLPAEIAGKPCANAEGHEFHRDYQRPKNCKGFILLGESGWHDKEYTKYRSIK
jgi:predicted nucleic acid-binding Zn ribbon protein